MRAIVAIVNPETGAADCRASGLTLDILEPAGARCGLTTLVEVAGEDEAVRQLLTGWGFTPDDVPQYFYGCDTYGYPYPYEIPEALLTDQELNNRSDLDDGPSFSLISEGVDQNHILWVDHPDPTRQQPGGRYLVQSPRSWDHLTNFRTNDLAAAVAELKRRGRP